MFDLRRRDFMTLLGGAAATWPLAAVAQQPSKPVVGFLSPQSAIASAHLLAAVRRGLNESGLIEGQNVAIEPRWAEGRYDRLPALAAELIHHPVTVLVASAPPAAVAAQAATSTIPIVFSSGADPVRLGLVAGLNRPGGNITGVSHFSLALEAKRLEILHELVPDAVRIAVLVNPTLPGAEAITDEMQAAARALGVKVHVVNASSEDDLDAAIASIVGAAARGLVVASDPFFLSRRDRLVSAVARRAIPAIYQFREFAAAGGLVSYGANLADGYRLVGVYAGRIIRGEKPADLPVVQPSKFELVINLNTAKALHLEVPPMLIARADEVIE
jgi:putative tryptophan/tyrosine transport system substrate-binding protein